MRAPLAICILCLLLPACSTTDARESLAAPENARALREAQTRRFEASDPVLLLKTTMAAMQDLQFVIDDAEPALGLATGTALMDGARIRLCVFVRPVGEDEYSVRAVVHRGPILAEEPRVYRDFFDALGVAMALP